MLNFGPAANFTYNLHVKHLTFEQFSVIIYTVEREEQVETALGFVPKKNKKAKLRENPLNDMRVSPSWSKARNF